jgi:hypothetical protein
MSVEETSILTHTALFLKNYCRERSDMNAFLNIFLIYMDMCRLLRRSKEDLLAMTVSW